MEKKNRRQNSSEKWKQAKLNKQSSMRKYVNIKIILSELGILPCTWAMPTFLTNKVFFFTDRKNYINGVMQKQ